MSDVAAAGIAACFDQQLQVCDRIPAAAATPSNWQVLDTTERMGVATETAVLFEC